MAIQVNGTEVISNSRALNNIASVDSTSAAAMSAAGVGSTPTTSAGQLQPSLMVPDGLLWDVYESSDGNSWVYYGAAQSGDTISFAAKNNTNNYYYNLTSFDNGVSWTKTQLFSSNQNNTDIDTDGNGNWVQVFYNGACKRSTNNAVTWTTGGSATVNGGQRVIYVGNNAWLTFSDDNTSRRSTDAGATWSDVNTGIGNSGNNPRGVAHDGAGTVIAIAMYGSNQISRSTDYGATWSAFSLSITPHAIGTDGHGNWVIIPEGTTYENYYYSTNNGSSWTSRGSFSHSSFGMKQPNFKGDMGYSDRSGFLTSDNDANFWACASGSSISSGYVPWTTLSDKIPNALSADRTKYVKKAIGRETFWFAYNKGRPPAFVKA